MRLIVLLLCCCVYQARAQIYIHTGGLYSFGSPLEISGYNYDVAYSYALEAVTEDVSTKRGGFNQGAYAFAGVERQFKNGLMVEVDYLRMVKAMPVKLTAYFDYGYDNSAFINEEFRMRVDGADVLIGFTKNIADSSRHTLTLFTGPFIGRMTMHHHIEAGASWDHNWEYLDIRYISNRTVGWNFGVRYGLEIAPRVKLTTCVRYADINFSPQRGVIDRYSVGTEDLTETLPLSEREIEYSDNATRKYTTGGMVEDDNRASQDASFNLPMSALQVQLMLAYRLR